MDINCKRATELLSDSMHRDLSRYERLCLGLHMLICTACRRWRRQVELIRRVMRRTEADHLERESDVQMPRDVRDRIASVLRSRAAS